jgi:urease accessory protein
MELAQGSLTKGWRAALALAYDRRGEKTVLRQRRHTGPLRVLRDLYPEGEHTCHTIIVHPPGGIAGGDSLELHVHLSPRSAALITTPGAGKWYGSTGDAASQSLAFDVGAGAMLEWLPQETIIFDRARADMSTRVVLHEGAVYVGWEILCLGRTAAGERFNAGAVRVNVEVFHGDARLWTERARFAGGDPLLESPAGLAGNTVSATLLVAGQDIPADLLAACRAIPAGEQATGGMTRLPRIAVARYLGHSGEDARSYFTKLWAVLRPVLKGRDAVLPRIWAA